MTNPVVGFTKENNKLEAQGVYGLKKLGLSGGEGGDGGEGDSEGGSEIYDGSNSKNHLFHNDIQDNLIHRATQIGRSKSKSIIQNQIDNRYSQYKQNKS